MEPATAQLLVGGLGIAGTLTAAVVTQILARRAERERREDEDETRWLRDRLDITTALLSKAGHVHRELYSAAALLNSPDGTYDDRPTWLAGHNNLIEAPEEGLPGMLSSEDREILIEFQMEVTELLTAMEDDVSRIVLLGTEAEATAAKEMHEALWWAEADLEMYAPPNLAYGHLHDAKNAIDAFVTACRSGLRVP
ncbi:hypothetical protein ACFX43_22135 [Nocardioides sp. YIM B13467]|uniref:hypothetical protein n=1 Tax=Nocardioides sp. YIM B13467 TaxID=3366294 RepID=UPI00366BA725